MRFPSASFGFVALASAQSSLISSSRATSTGRDVQPSVTETVSGPISTSNACAQVSSLVSRSSSTYPSIQAEVAYACLQSIPFYASAALVTLESLQRMVQFQSTLHYLKNPPKGYYNDPVDLLKGFDEIGDKVKKSQYNNEYDFETDVASLLTKAHDGHLAFGGMAFNGAFRWRRSRHVSLISASQDGGVPKVWVVSDYNKSDASYTPSAVSQIDGKPAVDFLQAESLLNSYHDPDTRYNAMFYMQPAESYGYFTNPRFYPGPNLNISFENGTSQTYINSAIVLDSSLWEVISDGQDVYDYLISPEYSYSKFKKRDPNRLPHLLEHPKDKELHRRSIPAAYPRPYVQHSGYEVPLAGYFIQVPNVGETAVLMAGTFNTDDNSDAEEFQMVTQTFLAEAQRRGTKKMVIDVRTNGGGKVFLGYDMYKQFFPSSDARLTARYRGHQASNLIGSKLSTLNFNSVTGDLYTSPFNYHSFLDKDLKAFQDWDSMYGPTVFNSDNFTNLLRYNLSDPLQTSSDRYSIGVTMTGYDDRSNFTQAPFSKDDIIILSDGICASTCSLFTELMVQEAGVRTFAIGGRPSLGPMQAVGGTKGSLVLQAQYLAQLSSYVLEDFASSHSEVSNWEQFLLGDFGINANDATVNFQDNIRKGQEADGVPTQFRNDTANCRIFYTPTMYLNITEVWSTAASVTWGNGDNMDEGKCVAGSSTTQQQQAASSTAPSGTAKPSKSKGAAASIGQGVEVSILPVFVCGAVVLLSMLFGASLI